MRQRLVLADNTVVEAFFHVDELLDFALQHARDRDAGPLGDDAGDIFFVHFAAQQARVARLFFEQPCGLVELLFEFDQLPVTDFSRPFEIAAPLGFFLFGA